jgi:hypothetical protein
LLVIIAITLFWCGLVPIAGAFVSRHSWRVFRRRFDDLRLRPLLDYRTYRNAECKGELYRFIGGFESLTDENTLWIRGDTLTIPVALSDAHTYILPMQESDTLPDIFDPGEEVPERIRWNRVSALTEGARVFVGGPLLLAEDRGTFVSTRENPLLVIFYDGPDRSLTTRAIRAGRHKNEYWNPITPYAFILNAFCQILLAISFLPRPAFRLTVISAFIAAFAPLFPLLPPGVLLTVLYRRLWWRARIFRAYRDLVRLPLRYFFPGKKEGLLPNGERYGAVCYASLPSEAYEQQLPLLIPEEELRRGKQWYVFGTLSDQPAELPRKPQDVFATFGALPGDPEALAARYTRRAYFLEIISWFFLLLGIGCNILFITMIIYLLQ